MPRELGRFQTVFTALHHFRPEDAKRILADATSKGRSIAIIEPFNRKAVVPTMIGGFLLGLLRTPFMRGMTVSRFLWCYPIPIAPLVLAWDGFVSCLRAYRPDELMSMAREAAPNYKWIAAERQVTLPSVKLTLTYLVEEPTH